MSTTNPTWDPNQYHRYQGHRARPALELLGRVFLDSPGLVCDLGCGPGNITDLIAKRWPGARVLGVDHSSDMLASAREVNSDIEWIEGDIQTWEADAPIDVLYANASIQWVNDHPKVFAHLVDQINGGGILAVQMPLSQRNASHRLQFGVLGELDIDPMTLDRKAHRFLDNPVMEPEGYYDLLSQWCVDIDIWSTTYLQTLTGDDPVFEWVKGTGARPLLEALDDEQRPQFEGLYKQRLREAYPMRADGTTVYPFPRLFMVATRRS